MRDGLKFEEVTSLPGGTPRDISDKVKMKNLQTGIEYKDKWGVLRKCILQYNERE